MSRPPAPPPLPAAHPAAGIPGILPRGLRIVLASSSPFRLELLRQRGFLASTAPPQIAEPDVNERARALAAGALHDWDAALMELALAKANDVFRRLSAPEQVDAVIGADTVGIAAGRALGKPASREEADEMLRRIAGTTHEVRTGWCLIRPRDGLRVCGCDTTRIRMRPWTAAELRDYLDSDAWQGKCGAYGLQWPGDPFVEELWGSPSNVIGLPLERIEVVLAELFAGPDDRHPG